MRLLALVALFLAIAACPTRVGPSGTTCDTERDCAAGQTCENKVCVDGPAGGGCTQDAQCNVNAGEVCNPTTHQCEPGGTSGGCANTSECPITQFCNTSTGLCANLADGFCRNASQCSGSTPVCSAANENVPGRCVQCVAATDCAQGQTCVNPGVCTGGDFTCPPNSTSNGNGQCLCNPGFHQSGTACAADVHGGEGEGEGGGGEGEGGGPAPQCDPNNFGIDCILSGGPFNNCAASGVCECNGGLLFLDCLADPNAVDIDTTSCTCIDSGGEGEGEGEGGGGEGEGEGGGPPPDVNESCVSGGAAVTCATGLTCIVDSSAAPTVGSCKKVCTRNSNCSSLGLTCVTGLFSDGSGICADVLIPGDPCVGDYYDPAFTWMPTDESCVPPGDPQGAEDRCIAGTCTEVCRLASDQSTTLNCFQGTCDSGVQDIGIEQQGAICQ